MLDAGNFIQVASDITDGCTFHLTPSNETDHQPSKAMGYEDTYQKMARPSDYVLDMAHLSTCQHL